MSFYISNTDTKYNKDIVSATVSDKPFIWKWSSHVFLCSANFHIEYFVSSTFVGPFVGLLFFLQSGFSVLCHDCLIMNYSGQIPCASFIYTFEKH